jgi:hypothetical protein
MWPHRRRAQRIGEVDRGPSAALEVEEGEVVVAVPSPGAQPTPGTHSGGQ